MGLIRISGSRVDVLLPAEANAPEGEDVGTRVAWQIRSVLAVLPGGHSQGSGSLMATGASEVTHTPADYKPKRHPSRGMYVLPSLFTAGNIAAGYYAITQSVQELDR